MNSSEEIDDGINELATNNSNSSINNQKVAELPAWFHYYGDHPKCIVHQQNGKVMMISKCVCKTEHETYKHLIYKADDTTQICALCLEYFKVSSGKMSNTIAHIVNVHYQDVIMPINKLPFKYQSELENKWNHAILDSTKPAPPISKSKQKDNTISFGYKNHSIPAQKEMLVKAICLGFLPLGILNNPGISCCNLIFYHSVFLILI